MKKRRSGAAGGGRPLAGSRRGGRRGGGQPGTEPSAATRCRTGSPTRQKRLAKIREAKAALEAEAKAAAEEETRRRAEAEEQRKAEGRKRNGHAAGAAERGARRQGAAQLHRSGEPHPEEQGRLHPGLQRAGRGRWRGADHRRACASRRARATRISSRRSSTASRPISAPGRRRPPPTRATARRPTLQALAERGVAGYIATGRAKHRRRRQARDRRAADAGHAAQAQAGGMAQPLPAEEADRGAGVRTDQAGTRLPPVPAARRREGACRVGADLHRPQPHQARQGSLSRLSSPKMPVRNAIWTGS